jgi:peptidoglycan/LPS O-acetylase OafA/YrhL
LAFDHTANISAEQRVLALDGLRGLLTILVVVAHFFGEVPNGIRGLAFGWFAVSAFFVLSGYLVGGQAIEKIDRANFLFVFYMRRICRTWPIYLLSVGFVFACMSIFDGHPWAQDAKALPLWSYFSFSQNFLMAAHDSSGAYWLTPTWTLTVEEHFYLLVPAMFLLVPRRLLMPACCVAILASLIFRTLVFKAGLMPQMAGLTLLPGVADGLLCGLIAAILIKSPGVNWARYDTLLRSAAIIALLTTMALKLFGSEHNTAFYIWSPLVVSIGCAMYILAAVCGSPEGKRLEHKFYRFFGANSYSIYLTHLPVLGLMHGLILDAKPDIATPAQFAVTVAALLVSTLVGWLLTLYVEHPITSYGRTWKWSKELRFPKDARAVTSPTAALSQA